MSAKAEPASRLVPSGFDPGDEELARDLFNVASRHIIFGRGCTIHDKAAVEEIAMKLAHEKRRIYHEVIERTAPELYIACDAAFDFLGGVDGAAEIRGQLLAALEQKGRP